METARKGITHEERVLRWGSLPDVLSLDEFVCRMLEHNGCDPAVMAEEICWKRRHLGRYNFCTDRSISAEKIRHEILESVPFEVPPIQLTVGRTKNANITVDRAFPGSDHRLEYESSGLCATYFVRTSRLPQAVMTGMIGRRLDGIIENLPDERMVRQCRYARKKAKKGLHLSIETSLRTFASDAIDHRLEARSRRAPFTFGNGQRLRLGDTFSILPDHGTRRVYRRPRMDFAGITLKRGRVSHDYIAMRPHGDSRHPLLDLEGAYHSRMFGCYLVRADMTLPEHLSSLATAVETLCVDDTDFVAALLSRVPTR